jgi:hypothetical protein
MDKGDMGSVWKTKYGRRRVRHDPPTIEEALIAASGLTDDPEGQVEIAASLMELPKDEIRAQLQKMQQAQQAEAAKSARMSIGTVAVTSRTGAPRAVIVERKPSRRVVGVKPVR